MVLQNSEIWRGGASTTKSVKVNDKISLVKEKTDCMTMTFCLPSKGGGYTSLHLDISSKDFPYLIEYMCIADRQAAMEAMSAEMHRQIIEARESDIPSGEACDSFEDITRHWHVATAQKEK